MNLKKKMKQKRINGFDFIRYDKTEKLYVYKKNNQEIGFDKSGTIIYFSEQGLLNYFKR